MEKEIGMKKLALLTALIAVPGLLAQNPPLPGRYFTPQALYDALKNKSAEPNARFYLIGIYDLTQENGQSCATRGTTTPEQLEQVFISYMDAHGIPRDTLATHDQLQKQTAASYAVHAFSEAWPCQK
jgi:hypothetical protein